MSRGRAQLSSLFRTPGFPQDQNRKIPILGNLTSVSAQLFRLPFFFS